MPLLPQGLRSPGGVLLHIRILTFAAATPLLLRLRLSRLEALLQPRRTVDPPPPDQVARIVNAVAAVLRHGRPCVRRSCLTRGLTLYYFLRREGLDVALCFGIGDEQGAPAGHCWLDRDGEPFLEPEDPRARFVEVHRFGGETPRSPLPALPGKAPGPSQ